MKQPKLIIAALFLISPLVANADLILTITENTGGGTNWAFSGGTGVFQSGSCCLLVGETTENPQNFHDGPIDSDHTLSVLAGTDTFGFSNLFVHNYGGISGTNGSIFDGLDFQFLGEDDNGRAFSELNGLVLYADSIAYSSFNEGTYTLDSYFTGYGKDLGDFTLIVGSSSVPQSQATPVPEPGTLALLGLGLAGMAARRKKKV